MKKTVNNKKVIKTMQDLDQYCYYVAGTVGKMLTKLFAFYAPSVNQECIVSKMKALEVSFGLGLQMTNIIKDSYEDFKNNWCYIPEQLAEKYGVPIQEIFLPKYHQETIKIFNELIDKAQRHLEDALIYTLLIPRRNIRIRLFCLWPLFFAIATLKVAQQKLPLFIRGEEPIKISRKQVKKILFKTTMMVLSNWLLKKNYLRLLS